jgi:hypothetical protein
MNRCATENRMPSSAIAAADSIGKITLSLLHLTPALLLIGGHYAL